MIFVIDCSLEAVIDQNITASDYSTHTAHKIIFTDGDRHAGTFFQFCLFLLIRRRNINGHLLAICKACGFADFAAEIVQIFVCFCKVRKKLLYFIKQPDF